MTMDGLGRPLGGTHHVCQFLGKLATHSNVTRRIHLIDALGKEHGVQSLCEK